MNNRPPGRRAADGAFAPLYKPPAKPDAPRRRRPRPLGGALARRWPVPVVSRLAPRAPGPVAREPRRSGRGAPHGRPPRPPVQGMRGIEWPPRGRPPRTPTRHEPSATRPREQGRCCPGARCCPAVAPGSGWCRSSAPPARALLRARGGRWHMPGRGPAARGAGAVNGLLPSGGETEEKRPAGRSPAADAAPAQFAGAPFLAGEAAPFRKLMHFPVKFACPPPPLVIYWK